MNSQKRWGRNVLSIDRRILSNAPHPRQLTRRGIDTDVTEARRKPNRPDGRLMSARVPADSIELGRRHSHQHQPSVFGFIRVTEVRPAGERHGIRDNPLSEVPCSSPEGRISVSHPRPETRRVMAGTWRRVKPSASNPTAPPCHQSRGSAISGSDAFQVFRV